MTLFLPNRVQVYSEYLKRVNFRTNNLTGWKGRKARWRISIFGFWIDPCVCAYVNASLICKCAVDARVPEVHIYTFFLS